MSAGKHDWRGYSSHDSIRRERGSGKKKANFIRFDPSGWLFGVWIGGVSAWQQKYMIHNPSMENGDHDSSGIVQVG